MYRTLTDLDYSRSPECPFIVDELSMEEFRNCLPKYENQKTLLPPDAQIGVRKSIAAALGDRKGSTPDGEVHAVVYPYSMDVERIVDSLCGPRYPSQTSSFEEPDSGSGTMSMDLGTEDDTLSTPSDLPPSLRAVGSKVCEEVVIGVGVGGFPGIRW